MVILGNLPAGFPVGHFLIHQYLTEFQREIFVLPGLSELLVQFCSNSSVHGLCVLSPGLTYPNRSNFSGVRASKKIYLACSISGLASAHH